MDLKHLWVSLSSKHIFVFDTPGKDAHPIYQTISPSKKSWANLLNRPSAIRNRIWESICSQCRFEGVSGRLPINLKRSLSTSHQSEQHISRQRRLSGILLSRLLLSFLLCPSVILLVSFLKRKISLKNKSLNFVRICSHTKLGNLFEMGLFCAFPLIINEQNPVTFKSKSLSSPILNPMRFCFSITTMTTENKIKRLLWAKPDSTSVFQLQRIFAGFAHPISQEAT
jgi:hypothetical protein